ncbi:MBL fold metallo-hydrolase [Kaistella sp. PBT33-4]|uniref:MBL fold metallo-hydrolase n=1 Tax=Kaistella sp. PBT33-4 TaxID=3032000 RepID=UPI0023D8B6A4|nr:MBL fold metallo-hydrolase [Kaistella sp. PBT33-4]MDF0720422.1 MBL fold metallo-hydrolase [Kaistella sp. PBT33-4]
MKTLSKIMISLLVITAALVAAAFIIINQPKFGKTPSGARLERIQKSPHYKNGRFDNLNKTPQLAEDTSMPEVMFRFLFVKKDQLKPAQAFRMTKTELKSLKPDENVFIWMGHSSYYMQIDGLKILVDPVLSGNASPFTFTTKAFEGSDLYTPDDIPTLDLLIITHDHWDHLDYKTVKELQHKTRRVVTGLGTGEHLEYWGYSPDLITELDWFENSDLGNGFRIYCEPARHFSGRGLKRDQAIWASFVLESPTQRIYIGGDSGYDDHYKKIGEKYGSFDLAILENGQYNRDWRYIHFLPGENIKAMKELNAKRMIPVHNSKFALAVHSWNEPLKKITELNTENLRIITPAIGQKVPWLDDAKIYKKWWEDYDRHLE